MFKPSPIAVDKLYERVRRLKFFLQHLKKGEDVPLDAIDTEVRLVKESIERWEIERNAGDN